ncbi:helix-turn-helix domain-containing protein [Seonamhaeicola marinus]|uniref:Helix-turn-helix transcriptional regulator n=1 Tax=Seonamhaeicola marinus TaxID=1912246 RepID=A0A5D0J0S0_9FLAO|nr:AraC family transcriptional regulator [Seonamhaeicola marinus]TYA89216.1 helix-turn-helix transcriptional regulator [Seonamhaeicola marinus]
MLYPIQNNETVIPNERNICILLSGRITIQNNKTNTFSIPSKSYFFFDKPFDIIAASPYLEGFVTKLDATFIKTFLDVNQLSGHISNYFDFYRLKNIDSKKAQIQAILNADGNKRLIESYMHILWIELLTEYEKSKKDQSTIDQFSELIEQNIERNYCAGTYAEMMRIPLKKLIREVKKTEHKTPCNFITEKVIEKAKYKLVNTKDTSQMIAYQLGFEDPYYFIKYFKKSTGVTPTQYRENYKI